MVSRENLNNDDAWKAELEARLASIDEGRHTASDWRKALERMRGEVAKRSYGMLRWKGSDQELEELLGPDNQTWAME